MISPNHMEPNTSTNSVQVKTSAKDFFLHLGMVVALYVTVVSFLNLVFKIIEKSFPEIERNYYWDTISMPAATLIIFFPIFITLSYFVYKTYTENPEKKELGIRKWLTYVTLFIAGVSLATDLVMVLYKFLDGQDLTTAFLLKALAVLIVAGAIFMHYLQDIRDRLSPKCRKARPIVLSIVILIVIILGFKAFGSPQSQRLVKYDNQKVSDLQNIQWQIIDYWQTNGQLPEKLDDINAEIYYASKIPTDPQFNKSYVYKKTAEMEFELCAEFNKENSDSTNFGPATYIKGEVIKNSNWNHKAGTQCFERIIDPIAYPVYKRG